MDGKDTGFVAGGTAHFSLHQLRSAIADISRALLQSLGDDGTGAVMHLRRAEDLLKASGLSQMSGRLDDGPRLTAWKMRRVLDHIEANLAAPLRNKDLACLAGYSEFHFSVAFRNSVGVPPHEFLIRRRMERARQLMLSTDMALCEIAAECGLADQAHLSRLFRRVVGESPAAWRRAHSNAVGV
jgi:AraC family transcriptional regulator